MKTLLKFFTSCSLVLFFLAAHPTSALACATCFGDSESDMAKGMTMGVLTLLGVVAFVLAGFGAFFVFLVRRAKMVHGVVPQHVDLPAGVATSK